MKRIITLILTTTMLASCAPTVAQQAGRPVTEVSPVAESPDEERRLVLSDARTDIAVVITALYQKLVLPGKSTDGVVFFDTEPAVTQPLPEKGFGLADVLLEEDYAPGPDPLVRRISGVMRLRDSLGREDYRAYAAEYLARDEGILILSSAMEPVYGRYDRIRFFFVEKDRLPSLSYLESAGHKELLPLVAKNAASPEAIRDGRRLKELCLFAFDMTKGPEDSRLVLHSDGSIVDAAVEYSQSINDHGWRFIMLEGAFRLGEGADYHFYLTDSDAPGRVIARMPASLR